MGYDIIVLIITSTNSLKILSGNQKWYWGTDRQYNDQHVKTNKCSQHITQKTKEWATSTPLKVLNLGAPWVQPVTALVSGAYHVTHSNILTSILLVLDWLNKEVLNISCQMLIK